MGNFQGYFSSCMRKRNNIVDTKVVDNDDTISRYEFEEIIREEVYNRDTMIDELSREVETLKLRFAELEHQSEHYDINFDEHDDTTNISKEVIERFVEKILKKENINVPLLPDTVEKSIYTNVFRLVLRILEKSARHSNLTLLGHTLKISIVPIDKPADQHDQHDQRNQHAQSDQHDRSDRNNISDSAENVDNIDEVNTKDSDNKISNSDKCSTIIRTHPVVIDGSLHKRNKLKNLFRSKNKDVV